MSNLTLEDLKKLELPVKLVSVISSYEINVTAYNDSFFLYTGTYADGYGSIGNLSHYKLAPRIKIVERDFWVNVYYGYISHGYNSKEYADKAAGSVRISCRHIKMKYEVDADTGKFIREIE